MTLRVPGFCSFYQGRESIAINEVHDVRATDAIARSTADHYRHGRNIQQQRPFSQRASGCAFR